MFQIVELRIDEEELEAEYKRQIKLRKKQNPNVKVIRRLYRYIPTHNHRKVAHSQSSLRNKKVHTQEKSCFESSNNFLLSLSAFPTDCQYFFSLSAGLIHSCQLVTMRRCVPYFCAVHI